MRENAFQNDSKPNNTTKSPPGNQFAAVFNADTRRSVNRWLAEGHLFGHPDNPDIIIGPTEDPPTPTYLFSPATSPFGSHQYPIISVPSAILSSTTNSPFQFPRKPTPEVPIRGTEMVELRAIEKAQDFFRSGYPIYENVLTSYGDVAQMTRDARLIGIRYANPFDLWNPISVREGAIQELVRRLEVACARRGKVPAFNSMVKADDFAPGPSNRNEGRLNTSNKWFASDSMRSLSPKNSNNMISSLNQPLSRRPRAETPPTASYVGSSSPTSIAEENTTRHHNHEQQKSQAGLSEHQKTSSQKFRDSAIDLWRGGGIKYDSVADISDGARLQSQQEEPARGRKREID